MVAMRPVDADAKLISKQNPNNIKLNKITAQTNANHNDVNENWLQIQHSNKSLYF